MPIEINGQPHPDGDPLEVNGVQADEVRVNGTVVWVNTIPPSDITNFSASGNRVGQIQVSFTPSQGLPTPQHDLYMNGNLVASNISSGYIHGIVAGDYTCFVRARNSAGSVDSNVNAGRSQVAAGSRTLTSSQTLSLPTGVKTMSVCMCGGGGAGHAGRAGGGGGSGARQWNNQGYAGQTLTFTQGQGGVANPNVTIRGGFGTASTLTGNGATYTAQGAESGNFNIGGAGVNGGGNGAQGDPWVEAGGSSGCGGSYAGGQKTNNNHGGGGGAGGFGNGGSNNAVTPANGGGGGSGGHLSQSFAPRNGANGRCVISWSQH